MGLLIEVHKKHMKNGIYYYEVDDCSNELGGHFYIGIDSEKEMVHYYNLNDLKKSNRSYGFFYI